MSVCRVEFNPAPFWMILRASAWAVLCDSSRGCGNFEVARGATPEAAREKAEKKGWRSLHGSAGELDVCPTCITLAVRASSGDVDALFLPEEAQQACCAECLPCEPERLQEQGPLPSGKSPEPPCGGQAAPLDLPLGAPCRLSVGSPARFLGAGRGLAVSAQDNDLLRGDALPPKGNEQEFPLPSDQQVLVSMSLDTVARALALQAVFPACNTCGRLSTKRSTFSYHLACDGCSAGNPSYVDAPWAAVVRGL